MKKIILSLLFIFILSCTTQNENEKIFKNSNILNVSDNVTPIKMNIIIGKSRLSIIDKYILIKDLQASEKGLYLLDKNTFQYIASTGKRGQGPNEIPNYGQLLTVEDSKNKQIYAFDYGKLSLLKFSLDSVLSLGNYMPHTILSLNGKGMGGRMEYYNDSVFIGRGLTIIGNTTFREHTSIFNIKTGNIEPLGYENPNLKNDKDTRAYFALSNKNGIYVNCYANQDLMTICKNDGSLLYNIYGTYWDKNENYQKVFYKGVQFYKDKIIATYLASEAIVEDSYKRRKGALPSQFLIFDLKGNYLKTLETNHEISNFCIDEDNNRIIMYLDDVDEPLAYLDLNGLLD